MSNPVHVGDGRLKMRTVIVAALLCINTSGCSWIAANAHTQDGSTVWPHTPGNCQSAAPVADTVIALTSLSGAIALGTIAAYASTEPNTCNTSDSSGPPGQNNCPSDQELAIAGAAVAGVATIVYFASGVYGFNTQAKCEEAELAQQESDRQLAIFKEKQAVDDAHVAALRAIQEKKDAEIAQQHQEQVDRDTEEKQRHDQIVQEEYTRQRREYEAQAEATRVACREYMEKHCTRPNVCTPVKKCQTVAGEYVCWDEKVCSPSETLVCVGKAPQNCNP